jgi:formylglycine-generating enzyme required for sulfatase activity
VGFFDGFLRYKVHVNWPGTPASYQTVSDANGYGLHDMAGHVAEWCNDWHSDTCYSSSPHDNPHGRTSGPKRLVRGGRLDNYTFNCSCADRASG